MVGIVHGSAVDIDGHGVLLRGPSGSGKSDLALRLIDRGAKLIGDDIIHIETGNGRVMLAYAPNIAGKIEVRGVGICTLDYVHAAPLRLVIEFGTDIDRMPPEHARTAIDDYLVPLLRLNPFQTSSALKVELALRAVINDGLLPVAKLDAASNESLRI
jgi:serine kinase of HPr protein (carbohydrate metabolism regulator)